MRIIEGVYIKITKSSMRFVLKQKFTDVPHLWNKFSNMNHICELKHDVLRLLPPGKYYIRYEVCDNNTMFKDFTILEVKGNDNGTIIYQNGEWV